MSTGVVGGSSDSISSGVVIVSSVTVRSEPRSVTVRREPRCPPAVEVSSASSRDPRSLSYGQVAFTSSVTLRNPEVPVARVPEQHLAAVFISGVSLGLAVAALAAHFLGRSEAACKIRLDL